MLYWLDVPLAFLIGACMVAIAIAFVALSASFPLFRAFGFDRVPDIVQGLYSLTALAIVYGSFWLLVSLGVIALTYLPLRLWRQVGRILLIALVSEAFTIGAVRVSVALEPVFSLLLLLMMRE